MAAPTNPILQAGTLVGSRVASTTLFLDDGAAPVLNVAHQWQGGSVNLSAGVNPSQSFSVTPVALGNTQLFAGPNILAANTLSAPGQVNLGVANIANALNVIGPTTLTGPLTATGNIGLLGNLTISGSATVVSNLTVGNTISVPNFWGNTATLVGPLANCYLETTSSLSSTSAALYLSPDWRVKRISSGGLAFQSLLNGNFVNAYVIGPAGVSISIANLTTPTT